MSTTNITRRIDDNYNYETIEALREVDEMKKNPSKLKSYDSFEDLLKEVEIECIE